MEFYNIGNVFLRCHAGKQASRQTGAPSSLEAWKLPRPETQCNCALSVPQYSAECNTSGKGQAPPREFTCGGDFGTVFKTRSITRSKRRLICELEYEKFSDSRLLFMHLRSRDCRIIADAVI